MCKWNISLFWWSKWACLILILFFTTLQKSIWWLFLNKLRISVRFYSCISCIVRTSLLLIILYFCLPATVILILNLIAFLLVQIWGYREGSPKLRALEYFLYLRLFHESDFIFYPSSLTFVLVRCGCMPTFPRILTLLASTKPTWRPDISRCVCWPAWSPCSFLDDNLRWPINRVSNLIWPKSKLIVEWVTKVCQIKAAFYRCLASFDLLSGRWVELFSQNFVNHAIMSTHILTIVSVTPRHISWKRKDDLVKTPASHDEDDCEYRPIQNV